MNTSSHERPVAQVVILAACLLTFIAAQAVTRSSAQLLCVPPPLMSETNPTSFSWRPGIPFQVRVDDKWDAPDRDAFGEGASKWNAWSTFRFDFAPG
jgi:hypothetical protein